MKINVRNLVLVLEDLLREETEPPVREAGEELGDVDPPRLQLGVLELVPGLLVGGAHQTRDVALVLKLRTVQWTFVLWLRASS